MNKQEFEGALQKTSIKPVRRERIGQNDVFVADGFLPPTQLRFLARFGVDATREEFPMGCFVTLWYVERKVGWGGCAVCDALHDPDDTAEGRQKRRIATALDLAKNHFERYGKALH